MALWGFATVTTARSVSEIQRFQEVNASLLGPVHTTMEAVQDERSAVARYLAEPDDSRLETVENAGVATDSAIDALRANVNVTSTEIEALDDALPGRVDGFIQSARDLAELRDQAIDSEIPWDTAFERYTNVVEAGFNVDGGLANVWPDGELADAASDPRVVLEVARAREHLAQEDAYMGAALAAADMSPEQFQGVVAAAAAREALIDTAIGDLRPRDRERYTEVIESPEYQQLIALEQHLASVGWGEATLDGVPDDTWREIAPAVAGAMLAAEAGASTDAIAAVDPFGFDVLGGSGLAVVLGLAGVLLSLCISVQIGRGLIVDLVDLRNSAMELAGEKLPRALKRLHTGAEIDVDEEAPVSDLRDDEGEVAQVAEALTAVHRSAIQSAVERAEALSGISAVYVYLARRSQVLLHRQLALLDKMERRIDDPNELEDLFRLDHLTTRMRRLAESLIILSGATPARGWRKPVPLVDVVRAAVAEVEDFTRVEVHDLPEVRMAGSSVADLTHLLAELIENAVVFSPPHTQAHVRGELVGAGLALEIEDKGLGMSADALRDANRRIDDSEQGDLLETDQLGLFVVNRLAHRHKVRITLQSSPYGGIKAVVLVPDALIDRQTSIAAGDVPGTDVPGIGVPGNGKPSRARALPPARVAAAVPPPVPGSAANGTDPVWTVPWAPTNGLAAPHERPVSNGASSTNGTPADLDSAEPEDQVRVDQAAFVQSGENVSVDHSTSAELLEIAGDPDSDDDTGDLPKRTRQANLAPQLRDVTPGGDPDDDRESAPQRTPDEARATMSAMRSGWLRGKVDTPPAPDDEPGDQVVGNGDEGEGK
jgi:anti-sigma regulatory factor (Ser/Thr protein kinase)